MAQWRFHPIFTFFIHFANANMRWWRKIFSRKGIFSCTSFANRGIIDARVETLRFFNLSITVFHGPGPGRPKGRKNTLTLQQRAVAEMVLGKPGTPEFDEFVRAQRRDILAGILPPPLVALWMHYLLGKPKETIELDGVVDINEVRRVVVSLDDVRQPQVEAPRSLEESETHGTH